MFVKVFLSAIISFILLYFVFIDIEVSEVQSSLLYINTADAVFAAIALVLFYIMRAYRWKVLLGKNIPYFDAFFASSLAYFFSLIFIFQAGELSKIQFLKKKYNIDRGFTTSTIIIERMLDVFTLVIFFFISLVYYSIDNIRIVYFLGVLGIALLVFLFFSKYIFIQVRGSFFHNKTYNFLLEKKMGRYLIEIYRSLNKAFLLLHAIRLKMIVYTFILWGVNFFSVVIFLNMYSNIYEIIGGYSILSLGVAAQVTPANIGQYELLWTEIFKGMVSMPVEQLIASGIVLHSIIILIISVFALGSWVIIRKD